MNVKKSYKKSKKSHKKSKKSLKKYHGYGRDSPWSLVGDVAFRQSQGGFTSTGNYYITKIPLPQNMNFTDSSFINGCKSNTLDYCGIINPNLVGQLVGEEKRFKDVTELLYYIQEQINHENMDRLIGNNNATLLKISDFLPALKNGTFKPVENDIHDAVSGELSTIRSNLRSSNYQNFTSI
jgi:hypothetical protein